MPAEAIIQQRKDPLPVRNEVIKRLSHTKNIDAFL